MTGNLRPSPALHTARRFWADEGGASLVEFALVITLFLFLLLAIIDFGRIGHAWVSANKATQLAARLAAVRPQACEGVVSTIVPTKNERGSDRSLQFGALCRAGEHVCDTPVPATCPGSALNPTALEIFNAVRPLLPAETTIENMHYTYAFNPDPESIGGAYVPMGFLGGPYVPMVTVEFIDVRFRFISQLRFFVTALTGQSSTLGAQLTLPGMSVSLPAEDLSLGMDG